MASEDTAARAARIQSTLETRLFINGVFTDAVSKKTFPTFNPATGEVLAQVAEADKADVDLAVTAARNAFENGWKRTDGSVRRDLMWKLAALMETHKEDLAVLETLDNGKPLSESLNVDVASCIQCFRYYAGWADKIAGKINPVGGPFFSYQRHEPLGVVGQIIPWNFPLLMAAWKLAPALACGCTVVLKPAEQTPLSILRLAQLIHEAGYPAGVVNVLPGYGPTAGGAISSHPDIDKVAFTGSTEVGRLIAQAAAGSNLKKCSLELGGKSPLVVCADANLDAAVDAAFVGVFFNQGQVCSASSRIFVQDTVHDLFVAKLAEKMKLRTQGNPLGNVSMGAQVSKEQKAIIEGYITKGVSEGATRVAGEQPIDHPGYFVPPTVFTGVTDEMTIAKEEIFGPVMSVLKFSTLQEVIERGNKTQYGLASGIFTEDINKAFEFSNGIKAGTVWINTYNAFDNAQPFGGFKQSGHGRELGENALEMYTEVKSVMWKLNQQPVK